MFVIDNPAIVLGYLWVFSIPVLDHSPHDGDDLLLHLLGQQDDNDKVGIVFTDLGAEHIIRGDTDLPTVVELSPTQPLHFVLQVLGVKHNINKHKLTSKFPELSM